MKKNLLFAINVDWYFDLHWKERIISEMTSDFDVTICYSRTKETLSDHSLKTLLLGIKRSSINPCSNFSSFLNARTILRNQSFDLIHTVTIKPNIYFGILARMYCKPIILTIPGLGTAFSGGGKYILLRKLIRFLYRFIGKNKKAHFVFENKEDKAHFLEKRICTTDNCTVVSGAGVDLGKFLYTKESYVAPNPIKVLFAARLLKGKGLEDLIKAINFVNSEKKRVILYIAGITDTDSRDAIPLSQINSWHSSGKINYLGKVEDMAELLSQMHILALPTKYGEGLPRILIEANACGRPVITTDIAGCNEFITEGVNGFLVHPGRIDELAGAIERLLDPDLRRKMGQAGRKRVEMSYSKEHIISQYRSVYQKMV